MKKLFITILSVIALSFSAFGITACGGNGGGGGNEPTAYTGKLEFQLNFGGKDYSCVSIGKEDDKNVVIPEYYEGKKVTSIGENAFKGANILSVVMPNSIATINKSAFESCDKLANVTLSSGLKSIGENAFWGCSGLTSITLPSKVSSIGDKAFNG